MEIAVVSLPARNTGTNREHKSIVQLLWLFLVHCEQLTEYIPSIRTFCLSHFHCINGDLEQATIASVHSQVIADIGSEDLVNPVDPRDLA